MRLKKTTHVALLVVLVLGTAAFVLAWSGPAFGQDATPPVAGPDADAKIANAMSAGPSAIAAHATILDNEMDDAGAFVVLREGDNGWFCYPDSPGSPSNDPMCADQTWVDWMYAYMHGEAPPTSVPGLAYMLQGGTDASNTDPMATEPPPGEDWITSPPHVMLLMPQQLDQTVFTTDYQSGEPWIMWAGTPYEHIMMPVVSADHDE